MATTVEIVRDFARAALLRLAAFLALPSGKERLPAVVAWAAGIASLVAIVHRFRFGTDLTDESFSMALPYRYVLGDKPFVDEISIQQTAGIVLYPFIFLFVKITRGSTYLVLFVRMVHLFVFKGVAAVAVYLAGRKLLSSRASALAMAFLPFGFAPASIPNVGYNIMGMTLLTAGTFLSFYGVADKESNFRALAISGFLLAVCAFAYPPMIVAPLLATPIVLVCAPSRRFAATGAFIAGGLSLVVLLLPMLRYGGIAGIRRSLGWGVHAQVTHTLAGLKAIFEVLYAKRPGFLDWSLFAVLLAGLTRSRILTAIVVPAVTLYLVLWNREEAGVHYATIHSVIYLGAFAPAMVLLARPDARLYKLVALVVLPSFTAAIVAGWASTQGAEATSLGFYAPLMLFALCGVRALERARIDGAFAITPPLAIIGMLVLRLYDYQYRDGAVPTLTERVATGPFKGIYTTPDRARAFAEMSDIVKRFDRPPGRVLLLYESIGYYLWFKMRPGAHCVWEAPYGDLEGMVSYWQPRTTGEGIVIRVKGTGNTKVDPILTPPDRLLLNTPHFSVYRDR